MTNSNYCTGIQQELLDLMLDTLSDRRIQKPEHLLKHLDECENCRQAVAEYEKIYRMVESKEDVPVLDSAVDERVRQSIAAFEERPRHYSFHRYLWPLTAAACVAITAFVNLRPSDRSVGPQEPNGNGIVRIAAPSSAEVQQGIDAFSNVAAAFDNKTGWIALSEQSSDIGLTDTPVPPTLRPVVVYVHLSRQTSVVSELTLAIIPGQAAHLDVPSTSGESVRYTLQVAAGSPHQLMINVELAPAATLKTTLSLKEGRQVQAGRLQPIQGLYTLTVGLYGEKAGKNGHGGAGGAEGKDGSQL